MKGKSLKHTINSLAAIASAAFLVCGANAQTYSVTNVGAVSGEKESSAAAINNNGQVAGTSNTSAFRYTPGSKTLENIGSVPANSISRAFGIAPNGYVVGDSTFGSSESIRHAAIFANGTVADLGVLRKGDSSRANGMNNLKQVVGFSAEKVDGTESRAFLWSGSSALTDLGTLGGAYAQAFAINDSGVVTGNSHVAPSTSLTQPVHAFIWTAKGGMKDLGTMADGSYSYGTAINASNHVAGYGTIDKGNTRMHAFLVDGTAMRDLGSLGGKEALTDQSFALGVNASDVVVGYTYLPAGPAVGDGYTVEPQPIAFIYRNGMMQNLNDLIGDAGKQYLLHSANAINDKGQIAVTAFDRNAGGLRALLLSPNIQPGTTAPRLNSGK